jgi:hypothetical protein
MYRIKIMNNRLFIYHEQREQFLKSVIRGQRCENH